MSYKRESWTDEEFEILDKNFNKDKKQLLSLLPNRSWRAITNKIRARDLPRNGRYKRYSDKEDDILRNNYYLPEEELKRKMKGRSWQSIIQRCETLGLERPKSWSLWTEKEESVLSNSKTIEEAMELLPNRNYDMISAKINKMGLDIKSDRFWTEDEDNYLMKNYEYVKDLEDMMSHLDRSKRSIYLRAHRLGLDRGNDDKSISSDEVAKLYHSGMYMQEIARELSIAPHTVKDRLAKIGIDAEPIVLTGPDSPNWKGGLTSENNILRGRLEYREWRRKVFERDGYTCQKCGDSKGGNLHAHHIENFSEKVDLRYSVDNGITLCKDCHVNAPDSFHVKYGTKNNNLEQLREHIESHQQ